MEHNEDYEDSEDCSVCKAMEQLGNEFIDMEVRSGIEEATVWDLVDWEMSKVDKDSDDYDPDYEQHEAFRQFVHYYLAAHERVIEEATFHEIVEKF